MIVSLDFKQFNSMMKNVADYSLGFVDGINRGKKVFLDNLGKGVIDGLAQFIDANAKMNPEALHHMYEWYREGSPEARLFNLNYTVSGLGLSVKSTFRQSNTASKDNTQPFYDKARIMELGIPVTIKPKKSPVLVFEEGGRTVFTKGPINIRYPGGPEVVGAFERTFDMFMKYYFKQSFLRSSGLLNYLESPTVYKKNLAKGSVRGRSEGIKTGYTWIANAKIGVENG
jgi:hypothetical protein